MIYSNAGTAGNRRAMLPSRPSSPCKAAPGIPVLPVYPVYPKMLPWGQVSPPKYDLQRGLGVGRNVLPAFWGYVGFEGSALLLKPPESLGFGALLLFAASTSHALREKLSLRVLNTKGGFCRHLLCEIRVNIY